MLSDIPMITTVIPTYRRPHLLRRAIKSALAQTYPYLQVCVYDNASGDETAAVVAELAREDPRVIYHCHPENIGLTANFTYGMEQIDTPFFSALSDDDYFLPTFYETVMAGFDAYPDAICSGGGTVVVTERGSVVRSSSAEGYFIPPDGLLARMSGKYPHLSGYVFRREVIEQVGVMDSKLFYADIDYEVRVFSRFPHVISQKPGVIIVLHGQQATKWRQVDVVLQGYSTLHDRFQDNSALPPAVRASSEKMLTRVLGNVMFLNMGLPALYDGDFAGAHRAAAALRTPFHKHGKALMLDLLASLCQRISIVHRPITILLLTLWEFFLRFLGWKYRRVRGEIKAYLPASFARERV